jgi:hypothetical protein
MRTPKNKIPKEKKGFNMLPEKVQEKISPKLAKEYNKGGVVRGTARGMGAAKKGGGYNVSPN